MSRTPLFTGVKSPNPAESIPATSTKVLKTLLGINPCKNKGSKRLVASILTDLILTTFDPFFGKLSQRLIMGLL